MEIKSIDSHTIFCTASLTCLICSGVILSIWNPPVQTTTALFCEANCSARYRQICSSLCPGRLMTDEVLLSFPFPVRDWRGIARTVQPMCGFVPPVS